MDFRLTETQLALQQLAHEFAEKEIRPRARELDREQDPLLACPIDLVRRSSELGLRTLKIPPRYGGAGADTLTEVVVLEEIAWGDVGFANVIQHCWREGWMLAELATPEQRDRFLPEFLDDPTYLISFAQTEPAAGSDNELPYDAPGAGLMLSAVLDGDEWVLNGTKHFVTNGNLSRLIILFARTDPTVGLTKGISAFLVPAGIPGFRTGRIEDKLGSRLTNNAELIFENCRIPKDNLLGEVNGGMKFRARVGPGSKAKTASKILGPGRACFEYALDWAKTRVQGGQPIVEHQAIAMMLADMATKVDACRTLIWRAAWSTDYGNPPDAKLGNLAKIFASEAMMSVASQALEMMGGYGVLRNLPLEKHFRDVAGMIHGGGGNPVLKTRMGWMIDREAEAVGAAAALAF